jgi:chromosome segregation ATPase
MAAVIEMHDCFYSIPQSADALNLSEKTIRNYIDRGILRAEKWNGSWRISHGILNALSKKKYGNSLEAQVPSITGAGAARVGVIEIARSEYDALLRRAGRADATEELIAELRSEIRDQSERVAQLEASSASGWTEARRYKQDIEEMAGEVVEQGKREEVLRRDRDWLRRELDRSSVAEEERVEELRNALEENKRLMSALDECESSNEEEKRQLRDLKARYRRDGFLD